jgi:hypothetical protein
VEDETREAAVHQIDDHDDIIVEKGVDSIGAVVYEVNSRYQAGVLPLRILSPHGVAPLAIRTHVYTLPVQPGPVGKWGDPLQVIHSHGLHERFGIQVICPAFSDWPWYADHPTNPAIRQESYLLKTIIPFADGLCPNAQPKRSLLGFSKSGLGAFTLMLRHPDLFACAGAWDAPLMKTLPDEFEMPQVYGTQENFANYQFSRLLTNNGAKFRSLPRFALAGYGGFREHMQSAHQLFLQEKIPHLFDNNVKREHRWDSGWLEGLLTALIGLGSGNELVR